MGETVKQRGWWVVQADTGGTFTDCLATAPDGRRLRAKVLSTSALRGTIRRVVSVGVLGIDEDWDAPDDFVAGFSFRVLGDAEGRATVARYDAAAGLLILSAPVPGGLAPGAAFEVLSPWEAPVLAARRVTRTPPDRPLPPMALRLATTRGTNALLERSGAETLLVVSEGFADLLEIGTQQRPDLFALNIRKPLPLYGATVEAAGRIDAEGRELRPLEVAGLEAAAAACFERGFRSAAIALINSHRNQDHEQLAGQIFRRAGFTHVSRSAALAPRIKLLPRAQTAVVDAYLAPVLDEYLDRVEAQLSAAEPSAGTPGGEKQLLVMTSSGGLVSRAGFHAKDGLLSGPAGGVVGAARAGERSGFDRVIAFDMGGTSTDVSRFDGGFEYVWEHQVGDARLAAPALAIETVAAGGGSVCTHDANGLRVGPESAGADPGPACYGAGGPLTLTDVNLLLGRLRPERFGIPVRIEAAEAALAALAEQVRRATGERVDGPSLLEGLLAIADERMADAIRAVSVRRGYDPADYALVAFGGAGGQHACSIAGKLGIRSVVLPPDASLLSADGLGHAAIERIAERQALVPLDQAEEQVAGWVAALEAEATAAVVAEGAAADSVRVRRRIANLRYQGQESTLAVDWDEAVPLSDLFRTRYRSEFGHAPQDRPVELESLRVIASTESPPAVPLPSPAPVAAPSSGTVRVWSSAGEASPAEWVETPAFERKELAAGATFPGPALLTERHSTLVVPPGWSAAVDAAGAIVLTSVFPLETKADSGLADPHSAPGTSHSEHAQSTPRAVQEELFTHRFTALVAEMGEQLRRTALSTNVKERLDFSCALLDADAELVVNAPHIPVHLGALGLCVRSVRDTLDMEPGDVIITNHPGYGGSHLPDVTTMAAVYGEGGDLLGYLANRAHHAEIGGSRPGSMPPRGTTLAEEGVVIPPAYLLRRGEERWGQIGEMLSSGPWPSRAVSENLADLRAQAASIHYGAGMLSALATAHGSDTVRQAMQWLTGRAARRAGETLAKIADGVYEAAERLDDGTPLRVAINVSGGGAIFDFSGSGDVHPGNLNATPAIVRSVILYVLRLLVDEPLPLNEGLMRAVRVHLPPGLLNPPFPADAAAAPAVVGGNIETSQRLTDTLLKALGLAACSQGTMNNVLWGTDNFGFYETVCGGAGAGPGWHGASAIHTHMTNTRITDAEIVERRYPVHVERFAVRRGSGGAGRWQGGDGAVRELTFLAPMSLSLLSQHRIERPYGMQGGSPGAPGRQRLIRATGETIELRGIDGTEVQPGDRLILETPGGGGWGRGM